MAVVVNKVKAPTQKEMYEAIIKMAQGEDIKMSKDDIVAFAEKKMEQLARKASSGGDKKNEEHEEFMDIIRDILSESESGKMKCGDILRDERAANFEWKDGKVTMLKVKSQLGGNLRIRTADQLVMKGGKALASAEGVNPNPYYAVPEVAEPLISKEAALELVPMEDTYLYDVATTAGKEYVFVAK